MKIAIPIPIYVVGAAMSGGMILAAAGKNYISSARGAKIAVMGNA